MVRPSLAVIFFIFLEGLAAQETVNFASLGGRVTDPAGGAIAGAVVTARQLEAGLASLARTDREGRFRFPYLRVGTYEISVHEDGFADARRSVTLTVGAAFDLPIALAIGATETKVLVTGEAGAIEASRTQIAATISQPELAEMPLNGRNFLDLALLVPGVSPTNTGSTQLFAETSAVPGQGLSIGSQRNFSNSFIVDGLSANDDAAGLTGTFFGLDVVQEFQVVTSGGQAEFGRALGGYVNVVTKSGTNRVHGDAYGFLRNQRLNAANALSHSNLPLTQAQYGATLDGPVVRDRTFYFGNFEQRLLNQSGLITISPDDVAAINDKLAAVGYPGPQIATGLYPNPVHSSNVFGKIDHQFSPGDQFSVRESVYRVNSANSRGAGGLGAVSAAAGLSDVDQTIAAGNVKTFSPKTVDEMRAQFTYGSLDAPPNDPAAPAVAIAGVASFGRLSVSPTARRNRLYEIANNVSHQAGAHAVRAGFDFLYNDLTITFPQSIRGSYSFSSLASFLSGTYNNSGFTQSFGNPVVRQTNPNAGFYVQDEWQVRAGLTVNVGLRYDLQWLKSVSTDANNVSPRLGFAWSPTDSRRTVVRGGFGLFYDRVPLRALANALLSSGNTTDVTGGTFITASLSPAQTGAPVFPAILSAVPAGVLVNFTTMDRHIQNAYSEQGNVEVERQVGAHSVITAGYQHLRGLHLVLSVNRNAPACTGSGTNNGCRPISAYGNNKQYSSLGDSKYHALYISFVERPVRWGSARISYTYSRAMDDVGEFFFSSPIDNFDVWKDYGRSDDDQRHRLVLDGVVHDRGFELTGSVQYYSALPLNITTGANTLQGTTARPLLPDGSFLPRNSGRGFDFFNVNARLSRTFRLTERFRLEAIAEAFNVLNHRNDLIPNGTFGLGLYPVDPLPAFGRATAVGDARTVQLALRVSF